VRDRKLLCERQARPCGVRDRGVLCERQHCCVRDRAETKECSMRDRAMLCERQTLPLGVRDRGVLRERQRKVFFSNIFWGDFFLLFLFVQYSALLHLPPLRFHCADGCWDRTQDRCNLCIGSQTL
jgi:hypothetical protein